MKKFLNVLSRTSKKIFWCLTLSSQYNWSYISLQAFLSYTQHNSGKADSTASRGHWNSLNYNTLKLPEPS